MNQLRFTWDEGKRKLNLKKHGLDFADAESVFNHRNFSYEDKRYAYSERRFNMVGNWGQLAVHIT